MGALTNSLSNSLGVQLGSNSNQEPETLAYKERVEADGGVVNDITSVNLAFKDAKKNNYLNNITAAYSPEWGIKLVSGKVARLYSITGELFDLVQDNVAKRMTLIENGIGNKRTIKNTALTVGMGRAFALIQPSSVISILNQNTYAANAYILDGIPANKAALLQGTGGIYPIVSLGAGASWRPSSYILDINTFRIVSASFAGVSSELMINNKYPNIGDLGLGNADGFQFGNNIYGSSISEFSTTYILNTADTVIKTKIKLFINKSIQVFGGKPNVIYDGDSQTWSVIGSTDYSTYPSLCTPQLSMPVDYYNYGVSGQSITGANNLKIRYTEVYDSTVTNVIVVWYGTNDIALGGQTAVAALNAYKSYCLYLKTAGYKVIVLTALPRTDAGIAVDYETKRLSFNSNIVSDWATFANCLVDTGSESNIGITGASTNTDYYSTDLVHLNRAGRVIVANMVAPVINSLLQ